MKLWMWALWLPVAVGMFVFGFKARKTKGTYWWEPTEDSYLMMLGPFIVAIGYGIAQISQTIKVLMIGLAIAFCGPALLLGVVYRFELWTQGLRPKYRQGK